MNETELKRLATVLAKQIKAPASLAQSQVNLLVSDLVPVLNKHLQANLGLAEKLQLQEYILAKLS